MPINPFLAGMSRNFTDAQWPEVPPDPAMLDEQIRRLAGGAGEFRGPPDPAGHAAARAAGNAATSATTAQPPSAEMRIFNGPTELGRETPWDRMRQYEFLAGRLNPVLGVELGNPAREAQQRAMNEPALQRRSQLVQAMLGQDLQGQSYQDTERLRQQGSMAHLNRQAQAQMELAKLRGQQELEQKLQDARIGYGLGAQAKGQTLTPQQMQQFMGSIRDGGAAPGSAAPGGQPVFATPDFQPEQIIGATDKGFDIQKMLANLSSQAYGKDALAQVAAQMDTYATDDVLKELIGEVGHIYRMTGPRANRSLLNWRGDLQPQTIGGLAFSNPDGGRVNTITGSGWQSQWKPAQRQQIFGGRVPREKMGAAGENLGILLDALMKRRIEQGRLPKF